MWEKLLNQIAKQKSVKFNWIKGHDGHHENERCDELANIALNGKELFEDLGYDSNDKLINNDPPLTQQLTKTYSKTKILREGDICRKCSTPVIKKQTKGRGLKPNQKYYFEYYLLCPNCNTMYMVETAKRYGSENDNPLFS